MFEAFAENGNLQFDALKNSLSMSQKLVIGMSPMGASSFIGSQGGYLSINNATDLYDMVAFSLNSDIAFSAYNDPYGYKNETYSAKTITGYAGKTYYEEGYPAANDTSKTLTAYCFRKTKDYITPTAAGAGLQLFDAGGALVYDSIASKPMRVAYNHVIDSLAAFNTTVTLPAGRTYAFIMYGFVNQNGGLPGVRILSPTQFKAETFRHPFSGGLVGIVYKGGILAIDVTGY